MAEQTLEEIEQEVRDAYAEHDREKTPESYARVVAAIRANTIAHGNAHELV